MKIVNYITNNTWHPHGQARLKKSLSLVKFKGSVVLFNENTLKCPSHKKTPYAFKLYSIANARTKHDDIVLWLDASFWAIRNLDSLEEKIKKYGFLVQNSDYPLGQWTSDDCLSRMKLCREVAFKLPMFSGGFMGFDFGNPVVSRFFERFICLAGQGHRFRGAWKNSNGKVSKDKRVLGHRHDMSVGSHLMSMYGLKIQPNNTLFNYYSWYKKYKKQLDLSKVYFVCEGGPRKLPIQEIDI